MKTSPSPAMNPQREFRRLRQLLGRTGYISQGSVQDRTHRAGGGAGYQWTRKVAGKTVTVALTAEQFQKMKEAVINKRHLTQLIRRLEAISRQILFKAHPHPARRKTLSDKVLGLN